MNTYPSWVCEPCGKAYGRRIPNCATYHEGDPCGVCGLVTITTEPRDYGHLKPEWRDHRHMNGRSA